VSGERSSGAARRILSPYLDSPRRRRTAGLLAAAAPGELRGCFVPLIDGGATAIALLQAHPEGWFALSSPNPDVVAVWESLRDDVDGLLAGIQELAASHGHATFAAARDRTIADIDRMPAVARAARFVYLRGTAKTDAEGEPLHQFEHAELGRDTVAYDALATRDLAGLLRERDVTISRRGLFDLLPEVGEDDVVVLDPPAAVPDARELRSFVGAVTAKGAGVLARDLGGGFYAGWPGMVRLGESSSSGDDPICVNTVLQRARSSATSRDW
jgi:hypothetical protein